MIRRALQARGAANELTGAHHRPRNASREDEVVDRAMRPRTLADYVGQPAVKAQMEIFISAARHRGEALDHVLIFGPPGLGKTTLAHIIANELGVNLRQTSGPVLERPGDLAALLTNLQPRDVLFVDEIHRLSPVVEEVLYPALEDFQLDIMIGEGPAARSIKLNLPPFTLVGATTRAGLLTSPLRDRFGIVQRLEFYGVEDLEAHRRALRGHPRGCPIDEAGARTDRAALARHAAHRQPAAAPRARLRRGEGDGDINARSRGARRSTCSKSTRRASTRSTASSCSRSSRSSTAGRSASTAWRRRSARSAARSRT